jgi:hypothetical protein
MASFVAAICPSTFAVLVVIHTRKWLSSHAVSGVSQVMELLHGAHGSKVLIAYEPK